MKWYGMSKRVTEDKDYLNVWYIVHVSRTKDEDALVYIRMDDACFSYIIDCEEHYDKSGSKTAHIDADSMDENIIAKVEEMVNEGEYCLI